jgi:hypothetical protein
MAKRKSSLSKVAKRASKKRKNPAPSEKAGFLASIGLVEIAEPVGVGVGAYAATRLAGRIGYRLARKKSTRWAKHAGPWTSVLVSIVATYAAGKSKKLERYEMPILVGTWIASLQGLLQTYFPRWGWILNDYHMDDLPVAQLPAATAKAPANAAPRNGAQQQAPQGFDDYIDVDPGPDAPPPEPGEDDFSDIPGLGGGGGFNTGIFAGGLN